MDYQALCNSFDFILDTASGDISFDLYLSLLKTAGVLVLVGFPSTVKFSPRSLNLGMKLYQTFELYIVYQ